MVPADPSSRPLYPVKLTSPSFVRRRRLLNEMYNMMRGCLAVEFDYCNNLLSSIRTVSVIIQLKTHVCYSLRIKHGNLSLLLFDHIALL